MRLPQLNRRAFGFATLFSVVIAGIAFFINNTYKNWANEVIRTNQVLCEVVAKQLNNSSTATLDSLVNEHYFTEGYTSSLKENEVDALLSKISEKTLESLKGMEGGFYFKQLQKFQGYSYPTSAPPKPVYGPPPRSYNIIEEQILLTIEKDSVIIELHQFDPAIFPLATVPIKINGETIGAVWTRTHIERELPQFNLNDILNIAAVASLLGFIVAVVSSRRLKKNLDNIRTDLELLEVDSSHRLKSYPGIFGYISTNINKMVDTLRSEYKRREFLEKELHQKDKMASLGKIIAGVAHEVKTPLAIIKTRIQMWQQKIKTNDVPDDETISNKSMQLVIKEVNRLSNLVNKLLIFSKPVDENFESADINKIVNDTLTLFRTQRYLEKAEIIFTEGKNLPEVKIDSNKFAQVLINIITNSYEAIEEKGKIKIITFKSEDSLKIKITDNGSGISQEKQANIFDPFYTTKEAGTGLGLSIAYEIIKAHKGSIEFSSIPGNGSEFVITLPIVQKKKLYHEK